MIKVHLTNNDGGGFSDDVPVEPGTTAVELFVKHIGDEADPGNYLIRVNRETCSSSYVLCDGDKVTITPTKIDGA